MSFVILKIKFWRKTSTFKICCTILPQLFLYQRGATMRRLLLGTFSLLVICELLSGCPVAARAGAEPGVRSHRSHSLGQCQNQFTEALRAREREREYAVEKARFQEALASKCAGRKWYELSLLECALFVPLFGLVLPFFGIIFFGTVRSRWTAPSRKSMRREVH